MTLLKSPSRLEVQSIMKLAVPIMMASLSQTLMSLIDIAMVGRLGAAAVAAVGLGGMFTYSVSAFLNAIQTGVQTVVARRVGQERLDDAAETFRTGFYFAALTGTVVSIAFIVGSKYLFPLINPDLDVISIGTKYSQYRGFSLVTVMIGFVYYGFYNGISRPKIHLSVALVANASNVVLNYGFIFGNLGLPELGASGAGLATALASIISLSLYVLFSRLPSIRRKFKRLYIGPLRIDTLKKVLSLAIPAGSQGFGVIVGFALFMVMMGWVSTVALAATEIVFNILSFSFMPAMGFLFATQTMVSEAIGRDNHDAAVEITKSATVLCMILMGTMGILFISVPGFILSIFTIDTAIIAAGILPMQVLGIAQFGDAVGMVHLGALRGAGDNTYPAVADILLMWLFFLPVSYYTAIVQNGGIVPGWITLAVYIVLYGGVLHLRFRFGHWRTIEI